MSVGLGCRFGDHVVVKAEYSAERGTLDDGRTLDDQDLFGLQAPFAASSSWRPESERQTGTFAFVRPRAYTNRGVRVLSRHTLCGL